MMFAFKEILYLISILIFIKWKIYLHWQINLMNIVQGFQESFLLIFVFEWSRFKVSSVFDIDFNFTAQKLSFEESYGKCCPSQIPSFIPLIVILWIPLISLSSLHNDHPPTIGWNCQERQRRVQPVRERPQTFMF